MANTWNDHAGDWDDNPDVRLYADQAFTSLIATADVSGPDWSTKRVLDFGCGTGLLAEKVAPYVGEVIAVDTSDKMVSVLDSKRIPKVTAIHCDILENEFLVEDVLRSGFDLIYASSVCGFLPDYERAVLALARHVRVGGHFIQWDWQASPDDAFGLSKDKIRTALEMAKFRSVRVRQAFSVEADGRAIPVLIGSGVI